MLKRSFAARVATDDRGVGDLVQMGSRVLASPYNGSRGRPGLGAGHSPPAGVGVKRAFVARCLGTALP
jgi:hypothetical protein